MWTRITTPEERRGLKPALVFQEIVSYLKGSAEAVSSNSGWLSLEQYLEASRCQNNIARIFLITIERRSWSRRSSPT